MVGYRRVRVRRSLLILAVACLAGISLRSLPARADKVFGAEPGRRSASHQSVARCEQCHVSQHVLSDAKCLTCHKQIQERISVRRGLHSRYYEQGVFCFRCHREHRGAAHSVAGWPAIGGKDNEHIITFDHSITGFPLRGKHAVMAQAQACQRCHTRAPEHFDPRSRVCGQECHKKDDVHEGTLGERCNRCHVETNPFSKPIFEHNDPNEPERWQLVGHHLKVECENCHEKAKGKVPAFKSTPKRCQACHEDAHRGRFKRHECEDCHTPVGWKDGE